jgi:hypothetical protein
MPNNESFMNLVNALSLIIGMQNLQENREQSAHNDIHFENELQAQYLLTEIVALFEEQNKMLREILNLLKGGVDNA